MNTPEMIYKLIVFIFSNIWIYAGMILLILTIRGDITKVISKSINFFKKVAATYRARKLEEETKEKLRYKTGQIK